MLDTTSSVALAATSVDARLASWSGAGPRRGVVGAVFRKVVNIDTADGGMVTLADSALDDAPWTVRVDGLADVLERVAVGDRFELASGQANLDAVGGAVAIDLGSAGVWNTKALQLAGVPAGPLGRAADRLERLLHENGRDGGMRGPGGGPFEAAASTLLAERADALLAAVRSGTRSALVDACEALVGLGPGLTPSGDDFLTGLAWVAAGSGTRLSRLPGALDSHLDRDPQATTRLGLVTLREAARGRVRARISAAVVLALRTARLDEGAAITELTEPVRALVHVGHTSGTDVLSGLVAGLRLESELRGSV